MLSGVRGKPRTGPPPSGASSGTKIVVMDNLSQSPQEDGEGQGVGRRSRMRVALPATLLLT